MCRQCASGHEHQCLGVVYYVRLQEFRECMTQVQLRNEDDNASV